MLCAFEIKGLKTKRIQIGHPSGISSWLAPRLVSAQLLDISAC